MSLPRRILKRWIPLAALATALSLLVYVTAQQIFRQTVNDPQIQLAHDAAAALSNGAAVEAVVPTVQVDIGESLAPFLTVHDDNGAVIASSGRLHGQPTTVPLSVLENVRDNGEERVTWQPEHGVRVATVVVRTRGNPTRIVLAGRSLRESERRTAQLGSLIAMAWIATLVGLLIVVWGTEAVLARDA